MQERESASFNGILYIYIYIYLLLSAPNREKARTGIEQFYKLFPLSVLD